MASAAAASANCDDVSSTTTDTSSPTPHPTVDALQEGVLCAVRPTADLIEQRVEGVRKAQAELHAHIEALNADLHRIQSKSGPATDANLDAAIEKLNNAKKRIVVVANLLQGARVRMTRLSVSY